MNKSAKELIQKLAGNGGPKVTRTTPKPAGGPFKWNMAEYPTAAKRDAARAASNAANGNDQLPGAPQKALDRAARMAKKESSMKNIIDDIIKGAEQNTFGRPVVIQTEISKEASELIQKIAAGSFGPKITNHPDYIAAKARVDSAKASAQEKHGPGPLVEGPGGKRDPKTFPHRWNAGAYKSKEHRDAVRNIGQVRFDIMKADRNKTSSWTPLDTAKTAGMLMALEEQGYSVKEASEYLGLTEEQIQHILQTVR